MRRTDFKNVYDKNIGSIDNYEEKTFNKFEELYKNKFKNETFNYDIEKVKLTTRVNNDVSNIISLYFSTVVSVITFVLGVFLGQNREGIQLILYTIGFALIIIGICGFVIVCMGKVMNDKDGWNIVLLSLESAKKKHDDEKRIADLTKQVLSDTHELLNNLNESKKQDLRIKRILENKLNGEK